MVLATGNAGFTLGASLTDEVLASVVFTFGSDAFGASGVVVVAGVPSVVF
jgi:hypothetical protein